MRAVRAAREPKPVQILLVNGNPCGAGLIREAFNQCRIPVEIVLACYENHANGFVPAPADPQMYPEFVSALQRFWLERVKLPSR